MKRIKIILAVVTALWISELRAQELSSCLVVEMKTGEKVEYYLSEKPQLKHNDESILLSTQKTSVNYETQNVSKLYLSEGINTGIKDIRPTDSAIQLFPESIRLSGFFPRESVRILSLGGSEYRLYSISDDGSLTIILSDLPAGVYIIKTNNQSLKITRQ